MLNKNIFKIWVIYKNFIVLTLIILTILFAMKLVDIMAIVWFSFVCLVTSLVFYFVVLTMEEFEVIENQ